MTRAEETHLDFGFEVMKLHPAPEIYLWCPSFHGSWLSASHLTATKQEGETFVSVSMHVHEVISLFPDYNPN